MKTIQSIYQFFIYTNILIALAAVSQCALTYIILDIPVDYNILLIDGTSTLLLYNFSLWLSKPLYPHASPYQRTRWVFGHQWLFWMNNVIAVGLLTYAILHVNIQAWIFLGIVGIVSLVYSLPIFNRNGVKVGVRQFPLLKLFHIAIIWSLSTVGLPVVAYYAEGGLISWYQANYLGLAKVVFLLCLTLPFDIRDMKQDSYYHLRTIPNLIGRKRAIRLCYLLVCFHVVLVFVSPFSYSVKVGMLLTNAILFLTMYFQVFKAIEDYHYVYLLDFVLVLQFLITGLVVLLC